MPYRIHVLVPDKQHKFLNDEANRSSVSVSELVRRALDTTYGREGERRVVSITHTLGRRPGLRLDDTER